MGQIDTCFQQEEKHVVPEANDYKQSWYIPQKEYLLIISYFDAMMMTQFQFPIQFPSG